jgi:hypothetical protein
LLGFLIGMVVGPVMATWLSDFYAHRERYRLTSPAIICADSPAPCSPLGTLSEGMLLDVDSKGFAQIVVKVELGGRPQAIEPTAAATPAQRLILRKAAP